MSNRIYMYGDAETIDILNRDISKVILFGGYLGYSNFGDILQLKEAIKFHTSVTMLEPVVICNVAAIPDKDFLSRLRNWFGVSSFVFVHDSPVDLAILDMYLIDNVLSIENLHVYGGGFLNRYWGDHFLKLIEGLLDNFKVDNYIIGGQQIDAELTNRLKAHFEKYHPKLIGTRDVASQKIINSMGFTCEFSFDDASDIIEAWARRKPETDRVHESLFIHLNTSKYTWNESEEHRKELVRIAQILKDVAERFGTFETVFLSAYCECRISVRDTLATIINLEDALPFLNYRVMDIAHMALLHDPFSTTIDKNLAIFLKGVGISSSYHTAMFCNMLGIPCYLLPDNAYYKQKREGLGENRTLDRFLENPSVLSYSSAMEQRKAWLNKLTSVFENVDRNPQRNKISLNYTKANSSASQFRYKNASIVEKEIYSLRNELANIIVALKEKSGMLEHLEQELDLAKDKIAAAGTSLGVRAAFMLRQLLSKQKKQ